VVALTSAQAADGDVSSVLPALCRFSILTSASTLAEILSSGDAALLPDWMSGAAAIFVYDSAPPIFAENLLRVITADPEADIRSLGAQSLLMSISADFPEVLRAHVWLAGSPAARRCARGACRQTRHRAILKALSAAPEGQLSLRTTIGNVSFFLDASESIVDIHQRSRPSIST